MYSVTLENYTQRCTVLLLTKTVAGLDKLSGSVGFFPLSGVCSSYCMDRCSYVGNCIA